ncbi:MAG: hypothetical protein ACI9YB_002381 [Halioglobus sp.]|jgi:hypothetical protein
MSKKELYRGEIISNAIKGEITQIKASEQMGISLRQTKRLCKRYRKGGLANLAHRNRGKPSNKKMNSNIRTGMLELIKSNYPDFGPQLIMGHGCQACKSATSISLHSIFPNASVVS